MAKPKISPRKNGLQDRAKDTVSFIIEATTQLLEEKGLKGLSTNKIVERAGVGIGTFYQYFPNKESIIHHLMERMFNGMTDEMIKNIQSLDLTGTDLKSAIDQLLEKFFQKHDNKKSLVSQFLMSTVSVEHLKFMLKNDVRVAEALKEKFSPYTDELKIKDWDTTIYLILYSLKGIQFWILFGNPSISTSTIKDEVSKMVYGYLKAE